MESFIENARKIGDDPKELAIVKHYAMKFMGKKKWTSMVKNRKVWDKEGALSGLWNTIIALHYHFLWDDKADEYIGDPNATINRRRHWRCIGDYWEEEIEARDKEIEELRDDGNMITKKEHKEKIKELEAEHQRECRAMEDTISKLKCQLDFAKDKACSQDRLHQKQVAFHNKTQEEMEKAHHFALKAASA